jgi:hypothetical protein
MKIYEVDLQCKTGSHGRLFFTDLPSGYALAERVKNELGWDYVAGYIQTRQIGFSVGINDIYSEHGVSAPSCHRPRSQKDTRQA